MILSLLVRLRALTEALWRAATRDDGGPDADAEGQGAEQEASHDRSGDTGRRRLLRLDWDLLTWGWFDGSPDGRDVRRRAHAAGEAHHVVLLQAEREAERLASSGEGAAGRPAELIRDIVGLARAAARLDPTGAGWRAWVGVLERADDLREARERGAKLAALVRELLGHLLQTDPAKGERGAGEHQGLAHG